MEQSRVRITASPFHAGECAVQQRVGMRDRIESVGRKVIYDYMPLEHREFYESLPSFFISGLDREQRVWGSVLVGEIGFIAAPGPKSLRIAAWPVAGDPLMSGWQDGAAIGGLGIEQAARRRARINGVLQIDAVGAAFTLQVQQSFGNCRQYIHPRRPDFRHLGLLHSAPRRVRPLTRLDAAAARFIKQADTFFIASNDGHGASDMSHRGGPPGFITIDDEQTLLWPDYLGNFFFNTLGNLAVNPRCGLLFMDFSSGDTLQLSGETDVLWRWDESNPAFAGAERVLRFRIASAVATTSEHSTPIAS